MILTALGYDGSEIEEDLYDCSIETLRKHITFLEERGIHGITVVKAESGAIVYECGGFVND